MPTTRVAFHDATAVALPRLHFPEVVDAFEVLGFRRLGRLERRYLGGLATAATHYAVEHRQAFLEHKAVPMTVLVAPDASALVIVDWWWDMPDVRIRSTMLDGSVVETYRTWDHDIPLPQRLERARPKLDRLGEQTLFGAPRGGRTIAAIPGEPADLWQVHRRRVAEWSGQRGTSIAPITSMDDAVALSSRLAAHDTKVLCRITRIAQLVMLTLLGVPLLVLGLTWFGDLLSYVPASAVLALLGLHLVVSVVVCPRVVRCRYFRLWRPRFAP